VRDSVKSIYESGAKARSLMTNVWSHDIAERMKIRRKVMAKDCGLGDIDVGTYPSNPATIIHQSSILPLLAGLGILGGGLAGGLGLSGLLDRPVAPPPAVRSVPVEFDLEIIGVDQGIEASVVE
jgi:hypothetical protein